MPEPLDPATRLDLKPAARLDDVLKTLSTEPLDSGEELKAFYTDEVNAVRGGDKVARIGYILQQHYRSSFYRAFLMGHQGVGKSTELTRLIHNARFQFRAVRFSAVKDLNPAGFKPLDVLLVMLTRLMDEVKDCGGREPSETLLRDVQQWFHSKTNTTTQKADSSLEATGEAGVRAPTLLAQVLSLGVRFNAARRYAATRESRIEEVETASIPELIGLVNKLLVECNAILRDVEQREWLFIGEDFDRSGIPTAQTEELFLRFGNIFQDLQTHMIFTIPVSLVYSERASQLPFAGDRIQSIVDTPVFLPDHTPDAAGRRAIREVLRKRMSLDLFADGQMERLIVASGGNLRDLFKTVTDAAINARLREDTDGRIGRSDADAAISELRKEYLHRLSESVFDEQQSVSLTYADKARRLLEIYENGQKDLVPDAVMFSLFRARAVQEFNGEGWFGVHPLVVEIMKRQGQPLPVVDGQVLGGVS